MMNSNQNELTFWDHLDLLRGTIIRCLAAVLVCSVATFCLKDWLFALLFAPSSNDFVIYRLLGTAPFDIRFINTELASQFMVHIEVSLLAGFVLASPYILIEIYRFIAPGLYENEQRHSVGITVFAVLLFITGVVLTYFIIFPFAFRFLATYQVNNLVVNQISLKSYISTLLILSLMMGLLFEMPVFALVLSRLGLISATVLRHYRRHAIVVLVVLSAIITPTGDAFTLLLVSLPLYLLYEFSIMIIKK
ncbi:MAG: twin-arginine translocase subunit TatC [Paludibacteraceae bacterium]|nr:twin-arginine translocase subunit TatC [Paludibacteraceae bacterium]